MGFCCLKGELKLLSSLVLSFIQDFEAGEFKNKKLETMIFICKKSSNNFSKVILKYSLSQV